MKVKQLQLTKAIFVPAGHNLPTTVADSPQSCPGIEMDLGPNGVTISYKGALYVIPHHMIQCAVLANEGATTSVQATKKASK